MVFINRYYPSVTLDDYYLSEYNLKKLRKEESMRIWHAFDHLITRMDSVNKKFKSRGDLTANAIQEIFNYIDSLKKTLQKKGFLDPDTTLGQFPVNNSTNNLRDSDTESYVKKQDFKALRK